MEPLRDSDFGRTIGHIFEASSLILTIWKLARAEIGSILDHTLEPLPKSQIGSYLWHKLEALRESQFGSYLGNKLEVIRDSDFGRTEEHNFEAF